MIDPSSIPNLGTQTIGTLGTIPAIEGQRQVSQNEGTTTIINKILEKIRSLLSKLNPVELKEVETRADTNLQTINDFLEQINNNINNNNRIGHQFLRKLFNNSNFAAKLALLDKIKLEKFLNSITNTYTPFEGTRDVSIDFWNLWQTKILTNILSESSASPQEDEEKDEEKQELIKMYIAFNIEVRAPYDVNEIERKESGAFYKKFNAWAENNPEKLENLKKNILRAEKSPTTTSGFFASIFTSKELSSAAKEIEGTAIQSKPKNQNATENL